jgi:Family of unknown function (DUF6489)
VKITVEVDCTPEEARTFCGLPDVKPMQEAVMARLEQHMLDAAAAMSPDAIMKMWLPFLPQNPEQFREMLARFFKPPFGPTPGNKT